MRLSKKRLTRIGFAVGLCVVSIGLPAMAQSRSGIRQGLPGRRISGGVRPTEQCASNQIVALEAANKSNSAANGSSVNFILPEYNKAHLVEFKLRDSQGETAYKQSFQTSNEEQLISIQIPKDALQADLDYQWYFSVVCNADDRSQNVVLSGRLEQQAPELVNLQAETAVEPVFTRHAAARR